MTGCRELMVGPGDAQCRKPFTLGRTKHWDRPPRAPSAGSVAARAIGSAAGIGVFHMSGIPYCYGHCCGDGAGNHARAGVNVVVGEDPSVLRMQPTSSGRRARLGMAAAAASPGLPHPPAPAHGEGVKTAFVSGVCARCAAGRRIFLGRAPLGVARPGGPPGPRTAAAGVLPLLGCLAYLSPDGRRRDARPPALPALPGCARARVPDAAAAPAAAGDIGGDGSWGPATPPASPPSSRTAPPTWPSPRTPTTFGCSTSPASPTRSPPAA